MHAVYMNTQVSSIALFNIVIPASGPILSCKDLLGQLCCLRAIGYVIAGQLSVTSITADGFIIIDFWANRIAELMRQICVAANLGRGRNWLTRQRDSERATPMVPPSHELFHRSRLPADRQSETLKDGPDLTDPARKG